MPLIVGAGVGVSTGVNVGGLTGGDHVANGVGVVNGAADGIAMSSVRAVAL